MKHLRTLFILIGMFAVWLLPNSGRSDERPTDPYLCLVPVPFGETGETRAAGRWPDPGHVRFVPGYPTPIFFARGLPGALYIDPNGRLRPHPEPHPSIFNRYYLGSRGTVFSWNQPRVTLFFDDKRGHFRSIKEASAGQLAELHHLRQSLEDEGPERSTQRELGWGGVRPLRRAITSERGDRLTASTKWSVEAPSLGIEIEGDADRLRLSNGDRSVEYTLPGLATLSWQLTELPRSGRAVLVSHFESRMLIIDEDLNLTRPAGEWRLPRQPEVLLLPETGEALVTTPFALFWLRDKRLSGVDICGSVEPPPSQPVRLVTPAGTEKMLHENDQVGGFWPDARNGTVLLHTRRGLFRLWPDGVLRKITGAPDYHYDRSYPIPGTDQLLVNAGRRFVIVDAEEIVFDSGKIARHCCLNLQPVLRNPATGSVLLSDGRYLSKDKQIRELRAPTTGSRLFLHDPAVSSAAWLPGPLVGGYVWDENDELQSLGIMLSPPDQTRRSNKAIKNSGFWLDFERFGFLVTMIRGWRKLESDLRLVRLRGQPDVHLNQSWGGASQITLFDPGAGDVLLGLQEGLSAVEADGAMRKIECVDGCDYGLITSIVAAPGEDGAAIVGAGGGLFRYDPEAGGSLVRLAPISRTGTVLHLHAVPWRGITLLEADFGNFTWAADIGLRRLDIEADPAFEPLFVVTDAPRRVLVRDRGFSILEFPETN